MAIKTTMSNHINELKALVKQLVEVGMTLEEEDVRALLLNILPPSMYNYVVFTLSQLSSQSLDDMISTLLDDDNKINYRRF